MDVDPTQMQHDGLTDEQWNKVALLIQGVEEIVQAHPELKAWCSDSTYIRYLRARDWNIKHATKMLKNTLEWRLSYQPHNIKWADVAPEAETGKQFRMAIRDKQGRAILVMRPRNENTKGAERQLKFLVYNLEAACRLADESGVGKMTWLIDFEGYSMRNMPSARVSLQTLSILQNHYPERLGLAVCYHPPSLFQLTWRATKPFIDPVTHKKIAFINPGESGREVMAQHFDMSQIEQCMGGELPNGKAFDLDKYAAQMQLEDQARSMQLAQEQKPGNMASAVTVA
jgi:polyribonucleotide 5'-hydroxyl-kinase